MVIIMSHKNGKIHDSGIREGPVISGNTDGGPISLHHRAADDPMRLYDDVRRALNNYFVIGGITFVSHQLAALGAVAESILSATTGTVTAVPLVPGGGKSTLIRALLSVFAPLFATMDAPIAQKLGGVIVVVEKSCEAHELEELCTSTAGQRVAVVIESPNDFNLRNGCPNGTATRFAECLRRQCPDYASCPLIRAAGQTEETPILIMLHARYQRHMEDMSPFCTWYEGEKSFRRSLLLVDELPGMFADNALSLPTLNEAETEIDQLRASYRAEQRTAKQDILYYWSKEVRTPFFKLSRSLHTRSGLVTGAMMAEAGFQQNGLEQLRDKLVEYAEGSRAEALVSALLSGPSLYHSTDQTFTLFLPRLKKFDTQSQLATFLFSGTATLSPELTDNPDITVLSSASLEESYARLQIFAQQGEGFSALKTSLGSGRNFDGVVIWLRSILSELAEHHRKILAVTYQTYSERLWFQLPEFQDILIPYIDGEGRPTAKLPYFGGLNGSNLYLEATCVVCVGLNRFEPKEYLSRTLALDPVGETAQEMAAAVEEGRRVRSSDLPGVRAMEHITLARDLVQLVFRSALRKHGEQEPIEFWLLHPPDAVLEHLKSYFGDCRVEVIPELPEACRLQAASSRKPGGYVDRLLKCLMASQQAEITPEDLRNQTGLSLSQFKEAKKSPDVKRYLGEHYIVSGSGRNTVYRTKELPPVPSSV